MENGVEGCRNLYCKILARNLIPGECGLLHQAKSQAADGGLTRRSLDLFVVTTLDVAANGSTRGKPGHECAKYVADPDSFEAELRNIASGANLLPDEPEVDDDQEAF